jgi:hypothetical protein
MRISEYFNSQLEIQILELTQKVQDPRGHSSGTLCQAECLPKSRTTRAVLSEFDEMLKMSDFDDNLLV